MARRLAPTLAGLTGLGLLLLTALPAGAQVSARDRQAAAEAYDRGTAAYLARDYAEAARWFETAHRLAPAAAALVQAVRAYEQVGNDLRVATLGLRLSALYPDDPAARRAAERALRRASRFYRIDVECEGCTVQLDGAVMEHPSFFVEPDTEHVIEAAFETGTRRETVRGAAGEQRTLRFEAPPPPEVQAPVATEQFAQQPAADETPRTAPATPTSGGGGGIHVGVTIAAMVATAALGGVLIWSGLDTLDGVPAYEMNPTPEGLADGRSREARTNWLIAGTCIAAAATLVLAIFTDWDGEPSVAPEVAIQSDGLAAGLRGRF